MGHHFDFPGGQLGIGHTFRTRTHLALDGQHVFGTQDMGVLVRSGGDVRAENHLRQTFTVAQVHEDQAAVIAAVLHPAHEADFGAVVGRRQLRAGVRPGPVAQILNKLLMFLLNILTLRFFAHCLSFRAFLV